MLSAKTRESIASAVDAIHRAEIELRGISTADRAESDRKVSLLHKLQLIHKLRKASAPIEAVLLATID